MTVSDFVLRGTLDGKIAEGAPFEEILPSSSNDKIWNLIPKTIASMFDSAHKNSKIPQSDAPYLKESARAKIDPVDHEATRTLTDANKVVLEKNNSLTDKSESVYAPLLWHFDWAPKPPAYLVDLESFVNFIYKNRAKYVKNHEDIAKAIETFLNPKILNMLLVTITGIPLNQYLQETDPFKREINDSIAAIEDLLTKEEIRILQAMALSEGYDKNNLMRLKAGASDNIKPLGWLSEAAATYTPGWFAGLFYSAQTEKYASIDIKPLGPVLGANQNGLPTVSSADKEYVSLPKDYWKNFKFRDERKENLLAYLATLSVEGYSAVYDGLFSKDTIYLPNENISSTFHSITIKSTASPPSTDVADIIILRRAIKIFSESGEVFAKKSKENPALSFKSVRNSLAIEFAKDKDYEVDYDNLEKAALNLLNKTTQCLLTENIAAFAKLNRKRLNATFSNTQADTSINYNYTRLVSSPSNTSAIINKLTRRNSQKKMLDLAPYELSQLMPYFKLYKTVMDKQGNKQSEIEFKFPNATNIDLHNEGMDIPTSGDSIEKRYTQEYGVKSFDWKFIGSDPFSYSNDIEATLVIHFNDFEQLVIERKQGGSKYRLLDLITVSAEEHKKLKSADFTFDIRADVGWSGPKINKFDPSSTRRTLFLTMTDYNIAFNQEGFFELTINYKSRLEQSLYDKRTNILPVPIKNKGKIKSLEKKLKSVRSDQSGQDYEKIQEIESELTTLRMTSKKVAYSGITDFLIQNQSIFALSVSYDQLHREEKFDSTNILGKFATKSDIFKPLIEHIDELNAKANGQPAAPNSDEEDTGPRIDLVNDRKKKGNVLVSYFFLGDLIEALSQISIKDNEASDPFFKNIRVITTDFLIYDPKHIKNKKILKLNISDIPISTTLFMNFYYEKVIKYNVTKYSMMKFIRDLISYCILNIFDECFGEKNLKTTIKTGFLDFKKEDGQDPFRHYAEKTNKGKPVKLGEDELAPEYRTNKSGVKSSIYKSYLNLDYNKIPKIAGEEERSKCIHALMITSDSYDPAQMKVNGNYTNKRLKDNNMGLYHLDVGSARGILKNINFSKTDQKFLREQRYTQELDSDFSILSNVFDVDIDLVGNTMFFPGQRIYINLGERFSALGKPFAKKSLANVMGLGGYHLVTSVESRISPDGFTTKIQARWESSGDGKDKNKK